MLSRIERSPNVDPLDPDIIHPPQTLIPKTTTKRRRPLLPELL